MRRSTRLIQPLAAAVLAAGLLSVPLANAQSPSPTPSPAPQSQTIPDEKLDAAAAAIIRVASVKDQYVQQLSAATEPAEKERIAKEAEGALEKAVKDQGLTVEEYNSIVRTAQSNPDVLAKLRQRLPAETK